MKLLYFTSLYLASTQASTIRSRRQIPNHNYENTPSLHDLANNPKYIDLKTKILNRDPSVQWYNFPEWLIENPEQFFNDAKNTAEKVYNTHLKPTGEQALAYSKDKFDQIKGSYDDAKDGTKDAWKAVGNTAKEVALDTAEDAKNVAQNLLEKVKERFEHVAQRNVARRIKRDLTAQQRQEVDDLLNAFQAVADSAREVAEDRITAAKNNYNNDRESFKANSQAKLQAAQDKLAALSERYNNEEVKEKVRETVGNFMSKEDDLKAILSEYNIDYENAKQNFQITAQDATNAAKAVWESFLSRRSKRSVVDESNLTPQQKKQVQDLLSAMKILADTAKETANQRLSTAKDNYNNNKEAWKARGQEKLQAAKDRVQALSQQVQSEEVKEHVRNVIDKFIEKEDNAKAILGELSDNVQNAKENWQLTVDDAKNAAQSVWEAFLSRRVSKRSVEEESSNLTPEQKKQVEDLISAFKDLAATAHQNAEEKVNAAKQRIEANGNEKLQAATEKYLALTESVHGQAQEEFKSAVDRLMSGEEKVEDIVADLEGKAGNFRGQFEDGIKAAEKLAVELGIESAEDAKNVAFGLWNAILGSQE